MNFIAVRYPVTGERGEPLFADITLQENGNVVFNMYFYVHDQRFRELVQEFLPDEQIAAIEKEIALYDIENENYLCG